MSINLQLESLPSMVAGVYSNDGNMQLEATTQFRKLLSIGINNVLHIIFGCINYYSFMHSNHHIFLSQKGVHQLKKLYNLELCLGL